MREIKFRAWDTYSKPNKMVQFKDGDFIAWHAPSNWKDCYILMQYTGLKDKNGKEIYEGDILKREDNTSHYSRKRKPYFEVGFLNGCFVANGYNGVIKVSPELKNYSSYEIVGNIYENPELLNND